MHTARVKKQTQKSQLGFPQSTFPLHSSCLTVAHYDESHSSTLRSIQGEQSQATHPRYSSQRAAVSTTYQNALLQQELSAHTLL